ncbi:DUF456 domain-containing protein [Streptomyces gobiensis]|uniref:DUF456 domain-containing protein n=1 Tax=Streptomyces gobiensis TaxID=2875706 RepID=UPI001E31DB82|nr:DUF456 domain-containing protein [Streptomyces gobiensis]UGY94260.1 DUF456 domain-containing protein [Streptomyces gobiensis]
MTMWQLVLVGLVMLLGLLGTVMPGVPGPLVVWAAVFWWAMAVRSGVAWWVLIAATGVLLINQAVQLLLPKRRLRAAVVRRRSLLLAGGTGIVGFFIVPVIGVVLGFLGGLYGAERGRLGSHDDAVSATRSIMRAIGRNILIELFACMLVAGAWIWALIWGPA